MKRKSGDVEIKKEFEPPSKRQRTATKPMKSNLSKRKRVEMDPEITNNSFMIESGQNMYDMLFCSDCYNE